MHSTQYGFRPVRGTSDALMIVRRMIDAAFHEAVVVECRGIWMTDPPQNIKMGCTSNGAIIQMIELPATVQSPPSRIQKKIKSNMNIRTCLRHVKTAKNNARI